MLATVWTGLNFPAAASPDRSSVPIVINEVGWSGTAADYRDEWIELHNTTSVTIELNGWHLVDDDNLNIALAGAIPPHGYSLIERGDDDTVADVPAGWTGSFGYGLSDSGEVLTLTNALDAVVDTANAENGGGWPAGTNTPDHSMERVDPAAPDTDANWATNDGVTRNGRDAGGGPLNATPLCRNSAAAPAADLVVWKQGPTQAQPGARLTYTLGLRNAGNRPASGVVITDALPTGLVLQSQQAPFPFTHPTSGTLVWEVGQLPVSTTFAWIAVTVEVSPSPSGDLVNVVTATTTLTEAAPPNNVAALTTRIPIPAPALTLTKLGPPLVTPGLPFTCCIALSNTGSLPAAGVILTDTLPPGITFITHTSHLTFEHVASETLVWQVNHLPTDTMETITITVQATPGLTGTVTSAVTATAESVQVATTSWTAPTVPYVRLHALEPVNHGGSGETAALINLAPHPVPLAGWSLNDDPASGGSTFPSTATIEAGEILWLAQDGDGFHRVWGFEANWAAEVVTRPVPTLSGSWPGFTDGGEAAYLLDGEGHLIDALAYGGNTAAAGWHGPPVPYPYAGYSRGQVLYRKLIQTTGRPVPDTNTAADWAQDPHDPVDGRRLRYPGWDLETFFFPTVVTPTAPVTVAVAPDGAFELVSHTLASAQESILLEGYTFKSAALYGVLRDRLEAGVTVTMLLEGGTAFGIAEEELWATAQIDQHPSGSVHFLAGSPIRYAYQHAKFAVIDGQVALLGTENFGPGGMPSDRKDNGTRGHRGFVVAVRSPGVVAHLESVFAHDLDPTHHADLVPYGIEPFVLDDPLFEPAPEPDWTTYTAPFSPILSTTGTHFTLIQAPENALRDRDGLLGLLGRAGDGDQVAAIQADERFTWTVGMGDAGRNPRVQALVAAAQRGAAVRLLLDGYYDDGHNTETCRRLNARAASEGLTLSCRLGNATGLGIHAKVFLVAVEDERWVHVGSINGTENASKNNREVALQFHSPATYDRVLAVFDHDWQRGHGPYIHHLHLPLVMENAGPPADYPLLSEVFVNPSGEDGGREWLEIFNPGPSVHIGGWMLGDAVQIGGYGDGRYRFPAGAELLHHQVVVVAGCATEIAASYGFNPTYEWTDCSAAVPDLEPVGAWDGFGLALGNSDDEVILQDRTGIRIDSVAWGGAPRAGVMPYPLDAGDPFPFGASLKRYPADIDRNDCSADFYISHSPSPGRVAGQ
jgi:uncharacterized repeat protein (TIGR01451 family)